MTWVWARAAPQTLVVS